MGCFKETAIEQMGFSSNEVGTILDHLASGRSRIEAHVVETLLADEGDEFTLSLFGRLDDPIAKKFSLDLLS